MQSFEKERRMKMTRAGQHEYRKGCPVILGDEQLKLLIKDFYENYALRNGWYTDIQDAIDNRAKFMFAWQQELAETMLESVFQKKGYTIPVSAMRQIGKSEICALVMIYIYENYYKTFGEPFRVAVVGPGKAMSNEIFKRLNNYIVSQNVDLYIDRSEYKETMRGDSLQQISISESGGTTSEGQTNSFLFRDEAHEGSDARWRDEILWTTGATVATVMMLGNGGFKKCAFKESLDDVEAEHIKPFILGYSQLKPYIQKLADAGLPHAQTWEARTERLVRENGGWNSEFTLKNVECRWFIGSGNFVTLEQLMACHRDDMVFDPYKQNALYAFIDIAYSGDRSIVTIMNEKLEIIDWIILKEANEVKALADQLREFRDICDKKNYTPHFRAVGIDRTGLGIGAFEILQTIYSGTIIPIVFSAQKKMEMFQSLKNRIITNYPDDRISFDKNHKYADMFIKETTDLEQKVVRADLITYHAPITGKGKTYDDFCDSLTACLSIVLKYRNHFTGMDSYSARTHDSLVVKKLHEIKLKNRVKRKGVNRFI